MRWRILAALAMLAVPVASLEGAETDALRAIDACIARLDAQIDVGYERIARRCPDLAPALEQSGFAQWLPQAWKEARNDLSAGSLVELRNLVARELATRATSRTPRVERLEEILSDLGSTAQESSGTWARFKKWVRSLFERAGQQDSESWLSRLVSRVGVSGAVVEVITYIALGLVVLLAGFIVFNELRLAGLLGRRQFGDKRDGEPSIAVSTAKLTWGDVERATLIEQPRLLLQLVAAKLTDLGRLPPAGAFTVRELVRTAKLSQDADRQTLNEIALTSERVRYAEGGVPTESVQEAVVRGRDLLARLDSPDGPATSEARA
jgi:hypothetical protein